MSLDSDLNENKRGFKEIIQILGELKENLRDKTIDQEKLDSEIVLIMVSNLKEVILTLSVMVESKTKTTNIYANLSNEADFSEVKEEMEEIKTNLKDLEQRVKIIDKIGDEEAYDVDKKNCSSTKQDLFDLNEKENKLIIYETGGNTIKQLIEEEIEKIKPRIEEKRKIVEKLNEENMDLKKKFENFSNELEDLEIQAQKLYVDRLTYKNNYDQMNQTLEDKKIENEELKNQVKKVKSENNEVSTRLSIKKKQMDRYKKNINQLRDSIVEMTKENSNLTYELTQILKKNVEGEEKLEEEKIKSNILKKKINEFK